MRTTRAFACLTMVLALGPCLMAQSAATDKTVTAVTGESWISHLHRSLSQTSMGSTGRLGPAAPIGREPGVRRVADVQGGYSSAPLTLHGEDIYRMNCRGCHGETGQGAPPEINSLINPVRATSVAMVMERMRKTGMDITAHDAAELAKQSNVSLLQRLHQGGESMPAFPQLSDSEIKSLMGYLRQLADVPGSKDQAAIKESPVHVGELIVKSTCHTCHSAVGGNPDAQQLLEGSIPPLNTLTTRVTRAELIRKVTQGAPIVMGNPALPYRGRMPVFYYLTPEEVADVYLYLTLYPPGTNTQVAGQQNLAATVIIPPDPPSEPPASVGNTLSRAQLETGTDDGGLQAILSLSAAAMLAFVMLAGGVWLSVHEMKKLSGVVTKVKVRTEPAPSSAVPVNVSAA